MRHIAPTSAYPLFLKKRKNPKIKIYFNKIEYIFINININFPSKHLHTLTKTKI